MQNLKARDKCFVSERSIERDSHYGVESVKLSSCNVTLGKFLKAGSASLPHQRPRYHSLVLTVVRLIPWTSRVLGLTFSFACVESGCKSVNDAALCASTPIFSKNRIDSVDV